MKNRRKNKKIKNKKAIAYVAVIFLVLIAIALASMVWAFLIQNIAKLGNIASKCQSDSHLIIEDACYLENETYNLIYIFLSRPITNQQEQISFEVKIFADGFSKVITFNNLTFYEYKSGSLNKTEPKIQAGEGKSFIIFLNSYKINASKIKEIAINAVFIEGKQPYSCGFGKSFKIKKCENLKINFDIEDYTIETLGKSESNTENAPMPTYNIYNLPW